jgi:large subunit ribosomal protein L31e
MAEEKKTKDDEGPAVHVERLFTIPLRGLDPKWRRGEKAVQRVRAHLARHLKADPGAVKIDGSINELLFARGIRKPPPRIRVRAMKFEDGGVEAETAEKAQQRAAPAKSKAGTAKGTPEKGEKGD